MIPPVHVLINVVQKQRSIFPTGGCTYKQEIEHIIHSIYPAFRAILCKFCFCIVHDKSHNESTIKGNKVDGLLLCSIVITPICSLWVPCLSTRLKNVLNFSHQIIFLTAIPTYFKYSNLKISGA